ncbi:MAG: hypothetical protein Q9201_000478 [Fulgogasparrea decipioides]
MTYTIVAFIWRKAGLSPSDFKLLYETNHIPLLLSLTGPLFPLTHSRFYIERRPDASNASYAPVVYVGTPNDFDYDAYCEMVFEDAAACRAFWTRLQEPEVAEKIVEVEERFIDRQKLKVAGIDETVVTTRPSQ